VCLAAGTSPTRITVATRMQDQPGASSWHCTIGPARPRTRRPRSSVGAFESSLVASMALRRRFMACQRAGRIQQPAQASARSPGRRRLTRLSFKFGGGSPGSQLLIQAPPPSLISWEAGVHWQGGGFPAWPALGWQPGRARTPAPGARWRHSLRRTGSGRGLRAT
jgi:hypothetical protein